MLSISAYIGMLAMAAPTPEIPNATHVIQTCLCIVPSCGVQCAHIQTLYRLGEGSNASHFCELAELYSELGLCSFTSQELSNHPLLLHRLNYKLIEGACMQYTPA